MRKEQNVFVPKVFTELSNETAYNKTTFSTWQSFPGSTESQPFCFPQAICGDI